MALWRLPLLTLAWEASLTAVTAHDADCSAAGDELELTEDAMLLARVHVSPNGDLVLSEVHDKEDESGVLMQALPEATVMSNGDLVLSEGGVLLQTPDDASPEASAQFEEDDDEAAVEELEVTEDAMLLARVHAAPNGDLVLSEVNDKEGESGVLLQTPDDASPEASAQSEEDNDKAAAEEAAKLEKDAKTDGEKAAVAEALAKLDKEKAAAAEASAKLHQEKAAAAEEAAVEEASAKLDNDEAAVEEAEDSAAEPNATEPHATEPATPAASNAAEPQGGWWPFPPLYLSEEGAAGLRTTRSTAEAATEARLLELAGELEAGGRALDARVLALDERERALDARERLVQAKEVA